MPTTIAADSFPSDTSVSPPPKVGSIPNGKITPPQKNDGRRGFFCGRWMQCFTRSNLRDVPVGEVFLSMREEKDPDKAAIGRRWSEMGRDNTCGEMAVNEIPRGETINKFLSVKKKIGSGGFATVFRAVPTEAGLRHLKSLEAGRAYALKRVKRPRSGVGEVSRSLLAASAARHVEFIESMNTPETSRSNLLRYFALFTEQNTLWHVLELLDGPDLHDFLTTRPSKDSEASAASLVQQCFSGIHYLHRTVGALHRDVKPENYGFIKPVMPGEPLPTLKLFDLGTGWVLPKPVTEETSSELLLLKRSGTDTYNAPETWLGEVGPPSDVWSAGLVTYMIISLDMPFGLLQSADPRDDINRHALEFNHRNWEGVSLAARELVTALLDKDPHLRPSTSSILEDPWLTEHGCGPSS